MTDIPPSVPSVGDLLKDAPRTWGRWGPDDEVGALNYLGPDQVMAAARLVRSGKVFTLQRLPGDPGGGLVRSGPAGRNGSERYGHLDESHRLAGRGPRIAGDARRAADAGSADLQRSTHYDGLGQVWYGGQLWNGYDARATIGGTARAGVLPIARRGIVGRGVLLDLARHRGRRRLGEGETFTHEDLMRCAGAQGVELQPRDVLVIRTGFLDLSREPGAGAFHDGLAEPGPVYSPALVEWFRDLEIPNLVTDTIAGEVGIDPHTGGTLTLHCALMRNLGIAFTEICDLDELAADCAEDGEWDFMYTAAPLKVAGGTEAPVNPIVIK